MMGDAGKDAKRSQLSDQVGTTTAYTIHYNLLSLYNLYLAFQNLDRIFLKQT
jgi:hypothetical protein